MNPRLLAALLVVGMVAACSEGSTGEPAAEAPQPVALDGTYRMDVDRTDQTENGQLKPEDPFSMSYAFRSTCDGDTCVATGRKVTDDDPKRVDGTNVAVLDFVDGAWGRTVDSTATCGGAEVPVLEAWRLEPREDGTLRGTRRLGFHARGCRNAYEQPVTFTRIGDVDPGVTVPDPAKEKPLTPSAGAGLAGRYDRSVTSATGESLATAEIALSTSCVRNTQECLTFASVPGDDGVGTVNPYVLKDGRWTFGWAFEDTCSDGAKVRGTVAIEWVLPEQPADPIQELTGTQRDFYVNPCPGSNVASIVLKRVGD